MKTSVQNTVVNLSDLKNLTPAQIFSKYGIVVGAEKTINWMAERTFESVPQLAAKISDVQSML